MGNHQSHRHSASSVRAAAADTAAIQAAGTAPAAVTMPNAPPAVRRYAPKQPGHSRPVLWLGAGRRQAVLSLPWIGLRASLRRGA